MLYPAAANRTASLLVKPINFQEIVPAKELSDKFGCDIIVDYPHPFFKPVEFKVRTQNGLEPISKLSKMVQSLKNAEEERMQIMVLASDEDREKHGEKIKTSLQQK